MSNFIPDVSSVVTSLTLVISFTAYTTTLPYSRSLKGVSLPFEAADLSSISHAFSSVILVIRRAHLKSTNSQLLTLDHRYLLLLLICNNKPGEPFRNWIDRLH